MIPGITEHNSVTGESRLASYATLHQATISLEEMGERTITTQVKIDGGVVPDFSGWELIWRGEKFVLPTLKPQAAKDNTTRNSLVDLVFTSAPIHELKRFYFAEMAQIDNGTVQGVNVIDKYVSSLRLNLANFVAAFNKVLQYYFPSGNFVMNLNPSYQDDGEVKEFEIDYMYIWDVLMKINEVYGVTWRAVTSAQTGVTTIRVGYDMGSIPSTDHVFQYGFEGGLLRFERHVEDTNIYNILLGRGGEKNIPYRYFKYTDPYNTAWNADPDAIHELKNLYFSRLLDSNFRSYVQGWKTNSHRVLEQGESIEAYDSARGATDWAYKKGHDDTQFDPVEYVKDDDSIALYGPRQGKLEDNDDIYPTIQGIEISGLGRVDEVVDVYITAEDSQESIFDQVSNLSDMLLTVNEGYEWVQKQFNSAFTFTVPTGRVGNLEYAWAEEPLTPRGDNPTGYIDTVNSKLMRGNAPIPSGDWAAFNGISGIPPGEYYLHIMMKIVREAGHSMIQGKFGVNQLTLHCTPPDNLSYRQVFTIWVKNIWQTTQGANETDLAYAHRVWDPILGDKLGKEAAVCFSDGWMAASTDYEFLIQKLPEVDRTKTRNGVPSEWKITLVRSDAEYEATGLYIPNTKTGGVPVAGDHFFFTGIDIPIQYVKWAEEKLHDTKVDALEENAWTNPTWVVNLDKIKAHATSEDYAGTLAEKLDAGIMVTITDPRFTLNSSGVQQQLTLGVRSVKFTWNEPSDKSPYTVPDIEVVLSDKIEHVETYEGMQQGITYISRNYVTTSQAKKMARTQQNVQNEVAIDGNICYFGTVIGSVEE